MDGQEPWTEVLARLRPLLEQIFAAHGISPARAREIVEEAGMVLISKRPRHQDPDAWLLRMVIESCQRLSEKEDRKNPSR